MDTLGNPGLEAESMSGSILSGNFLPGNYMILRTLFSSLSIPESIQISFTSEELKKKLVDKLGLLKDKEIKSFYYGKNPGLLEAVKMIYEECDELVPVYEQASEQSQRFHYDRTFKNISEQNDVSEMAKIAAMSPPLTEETWYITVTQKKLEILKSKLSSIVSLYGQTTGKVKEDKFEQKGRMELKRFLTNLEENLPDMGLDPIVIMALYRSISILAAAIPNDDLNPFLIDVMENLYGVLCHPEDYYSYCKQEKIIDERVGRAFLECCPEFFNTFTSIYIEEYPKMDFQEQINFQKCFDMSQDNSQLIMMCSPVFIVTQQSQGMQK